MTRITVEEYEGGERLDAYLFQKLPEFSRTYFQKLIKAGSVTLNDKKPKPHTTVKDGDEIIIEEPKEKLREETEALPPLDIVDETNEFLVINKQSGLLVHPGPKQKIDTLVDLILKHDPKIKGIGESDLRPGIMHRLDRDASGLMVIAKTQKSFENLKQQFKDHKIEKEYTALVHGKVSKDSGVIEAYIGRMKTKGRMAARVTPMKGDKEALSMYEVVMRFPHASLVKMRTETGRMHQVRVHLKSLGHPIAGDTLYTPTKLRTGSLRPPRLFLHASTLGFVDTSGKKHLYHSDLPQQLNDFLKGLKTKHKKES